MVTVSVQLKAFLQGKGFRFGIVALMLIFLTQCFGELEMHDKVEGRTSCAVVKKAFFDDTRSVSEMRQELSKRDDLPDLSCRFLFAESTYGDFRFYQRADSAIALLLVRGSDWGEQLRIRSSESVLAEDIARNYMRYPRSPANGEHATESYFAIGIGGVCTRYILFDEFGRPSRKTYPAASKNCNPSDELVLWLDYLDSKGLIWQ